MLKRTYFPEILLVIKLSAHDVARTSECLSGHFHQTESPIFSREIEKCPLNFEIFFLGLGSNGITLRWGTLLVIYIIKRM